MTKSFENLLRENGVKFPRWFRRRFERPWTEVEDALDELKESRTKLEAEWSYEVKHFQEAWLKEIPPIEWKENVKLTSLDVAWETLELATLETIAVGDNLFARRNNVDHKLRKEWVEEIVAEAPEGCKLVVIKDSYQFSPDVRRLFEEHVQRGEECYNAICDICVYWVAFNPERIDEWDLSRWCMTRASSTVEYIK